MRPRRLDHGLADRQLSRLDARLIAAAAIVLIVGSAAACAGGPQSGLQGADVAASTPSSVRPVGGPSSRTTVVPADRWPDLAVSDRDNGRTVKLHSGQALVLSLGGAAPGGLYWQVQEAAPRSVLSSGASRHQPCAPHGPVIAGELCGTVSRTFVATSAGTATVTATRQSCGEALQCPPSASRFRLTVLALGSEK
jgi:predicted secreted protein